MDQARCHEYGSGVEVHLHHSLRQHCKGMGGWLHALAPLPLGEEPLVGIACRVGHSRSGCVMKRLIFSSAGTRTACV